MNTRKVLTIPDRVVIIPVFNVEKNLLLDVTAAAAAITTPRYVSRML